MKQLEQIFERVNEEIFRLDQQVNCSPSEPMYKDFLLFPRKKLRMRKIKSGYPLPRAWFIQERLDDEATGLEQNVTQSGIGLTSGFRSAIVREGKFLLKLKGVSEEGRCVYNFQEKDIEHRGLCTQSEAVKEQLKYLELLSYDLPHAISFPVYIEQHLSLNQLSNRVILELFRRNPHRVSLDNERELDLLEGGEKIERFNKKTYKTQRNKPIHTYRYVSAFAILGDTRLDEVVYHLTRKPLEGSLKESRDQILFNLFFMAGWAKSRLTSQGYTWGNNLKVTNNHIGNFVIHYLRPGEISVGLCDLVGLKRKSDFENDEEFYELAEAELNSFREDLDDKTCSLPFELDYGHFPIELKDRCFQAMQTGYSSGIYGLYKKSGLIFPLIKPNDTLVPDELVINKADFKKRVAEIQG